MSKSTLSFLGPQESKKRYKTFHQNFNNEANSQNLSFDVYNDYDEANSEQMNLYKRELLPSSNYHKRFQQKNSPCFFSFNTHWNGNKTKHFGNYQIKEDIPRKYNQLTLDPLETSLPLEVALKIDRHPIRPRSAFGLFLRDKKHEILRMNPNVPFRQLIKEARNAWFNQIDQKEKDIYEKKRADLMEIFCKRVKEYQENKRRALEEYYKKRDQDKQGQKSVKPRKAFSLFKFDQAAKIKEQYPQASFKEKCQIMKKMWKELPSQEKSLYVLRSRLEYQKYSLI